MHRMSAVLTLQGAVAHCDMPLESGPTMLLPYSQRFAGGYVAFYRPEFIEYFAEHHVQTPLRKGDAVFFNPALYHGAGTNTSADIRRMANLLQISSPFGRAMESLDRTAMVRAVYPALRAMQAAGRPAREVLNAVVATAEGYPFPTNLDSDQPIGSLAPPSQVDLVLDALAADYPTQLLDAALRGQEERRTPMTTLGLIGLGRIGAFHTETLTNLPELRRSGHHRRAARCGPGGGGQIRCHAGGFGGGAAVLRVSTVWWWPPPPPRMRR